MSRYEHISESRHGLYCWIRAEILKQQGLAPKEAAAEALRAYPKARQHYKPPCETTASTKSPASAGASSNSQNRAAAASAGATSGSSGASDAH